MTSINLFPTEDRQTLRANKLNINFEFASYSSSLTIRDNDKELTIYLDERVVMDHVLNSVNNLNVSYKTNKDYLLELFKKTVDKVNQMEEEAKDEMAAYLVNNLNSKSEVKN